MKRRQPVGQGAVDRAQAVQVAVEGTAEMLLARESSRRRRSTRCGSARRASARAPGTRGCARPPAAHGRVGVREAAELVGEPLARLVLEGVRVHGVDRRARAPAAKALSSAGRVGLVPGDVQRDPGGGRARACWTTSQSSSFSKTFAGLRRGRGSARSACRRCPRPMRAAATRKAPARSVSRSISTPRRREPPAEVLVVLRERGEALLVLLGDLRVAQRNPMAALPSSTLGAALRHRVKAATLPASTFRMLPVDLAERSEAKK